MFSKKHLLLLNCSVVVNNIVLVTIVDSSVTEVDFSTDIHRLVSCGTDRDTPT